MGTHYARPCNTGSSLPAAMRQCRATADNLSCFPLSNNSESAQLKIPTRCRQKPKSEFCAPKPAPEVQSLTIAHLFPPPVQRCLWNALHRLAGKIFALQSRCITTRPHDANYFIVCFFLDLARQSTINTC